MNQTLTTQIGIAIYSSVMLIAFWYLLQLWRDYRIQAYRQDLFEIRNRLFEFARAGAISFDHPVYRALRGQINALIRYAYHFNFETLLVNQIFRKAKRTDAVPGFSEVLSRYPGLSQDQRHALLGIYSQVIWACMLQVGLTSLLAWPCFAAVWASEKIKQWMNRILTQDAPVDFAFSKIPPVMVMHVEYLECQAVETEREREGYLSAKA